MNSTQIKIIALLLMTVDHIGCFMPCISDMAQTVMRMIGRLSAPIFLFCIINSWNCISALKKRKLLYNLWFMGTVMSVGNYVLPALLRILTGETLKVEVRNNIFISLLTILCFLFVYERTNQLISILVITGVSAVSLGIAYMAELIDAITTNTTMVEAILRITASIIPSVLFSEGGISFFILGIGIYCWLNNRKKLVLFFIGYHLTIAVLTAVPIISWICHQLFSIKTAAVVLGVLHEIGIPVISKSLFSIVGCQWMAVFALPIIIKYNGARGRGLKWLFYLYYPVHIWCIIIIAQCY